MCFPDWSARNKNANIMQSSQFSLKNFEKLWSYKRYWHRYWKKNYFYLTKFLWINRTSMPNTPQCTFIWLVVIWHITITLLQSLITLRLPIHPSRGAHCCSWKGFVNFRSTCPLVFEQNSCSKNFWKLPSKTTIVASFPTTLVGLPGSFLKPFIL